MNISPGMPTWQKRAIAIGGLLLAVPGLFLALGYFFLILILLIEGDLNEIGVR